MLFSLVYSLSHPSFHLLTVRQNTEGEGEENHPLRDFLEDFWSQSFQLGANPCIATTVPLPKTQQTPGTVSSIFHPKSFTCPPLTFPWGRGCRHRTYANQVSSCRSCSSWTSSRSLQLPTQSAKHLGIKLHKRQAGAGFVNSYR